MATPGLYDDDIRIKEVKKAENVLSDSSLKAERRDFHPSRDKESTVSILENLPAYEIGNALTNDLFSRRKSPEAQELRNFFLNREAQIESERSARLEILCTEDSLVLNEEIKPSELAKKILDFKEPSDVADLFDQELRSKYSNAFQGFDKFTFGYQLLLGTLDNTDLKTSDIALAMERHIGTNKTYEVLDNMGLFPEIEKNEDKRLGYEFDLAKENLSGYDLGHFFRDAF